MEWSVCVVSNCWCGSIGMATAACGVMLCQKWWDIALRQRPILLNNKHKKLDFRLFNIIFGVCYGIYMLGRSLCRRWNGTIDIMLAKSSNCCCLRINGQIFYYISAKSNIRLSKSLPKVCCCSICMELHYFLKFDYSAMQYISTSNYTPYTNMHVHYLFNTMALLFTLHPVDRESNITTSPSHAHRKHNKTI